MISPLSIARRRTTYRPYELRRRDAEDDAEAERQDDDDQVLRVEAQRDLGERRPEHADDADERRRDPQVHQRPADRRVVADVVDALAHRPTFRTTAVSVSPTRARSSPPGRAARAESWGGSSRTTAATKYRTATTRMSRSGAAG